MNVYPFIAAEKAAAHGSVRTQGSRSKRRLTGSRVNSSVHGDARPSHLQPAR